MTSTSTFGARAARTEEALLTGPEYRPVPWFKRLLDFLVILLALPAAVCIFALVSLYIKLVSRGPVLFVQERVGHGGKRFRLFKFRTMHAGNDGSVHQRHLAELMRTNRPMRKLDGSGDARIIPLGRLLRSSGLDELPQLINVVRGEMSVVGPRPCTPYEYALYKPWHKERLSALPGLTGLWQVSGKNRTTFDEMVTLDVRYARKPSLALDLWIITRTVPALLIQMKDQWPARQAASRMAAAAGSTQPESA